LGQHLKSFCVEIALQQNKFTLQEIFYQRGRAQYGPRRLPGHGLLPMTNRPEKGTLDRDGEEVEDRIYNARDFDRTLMLDDRTRLIAKRSPSFSRKAATVFQKTILCCVDQEHAARMRQALINETADLVTNNHRYVMRITGKDKDGQDHLGNFIDPESTYPVLVTTSRLLSTGVDAQSCRLIVLDRDVGIDDRVQADRWARHPRARGHQEVLFHADRLPGRF
jgi:hypothetical protein